MDEMYSPAIARQLRRRKHDVLAVVERDDLASQSDREVFTRMASERRAIVTNDGADYIPLFNEALAAGQDHFGLLPTDDRSLPRTRGGIGKLVRVLHTFLREHPAEDALRNRLWWLP